MAGTFDGPINFYGVNILTDPVLGSRVGIHVAGPLVLGMKRYVAPALTFREQPPVDLVLLSQSGITDCLLEEVSAVPSAGGTLTLTNSTAYPYYTAGSTTTLSTLAGSTASAVTPLGNVGPDASPNNVQFLLLGVGTNNTLYSYDLLQNQYWVQGQGTSSGTSQAIADQVIQMSAIYGVATTANASISNAWAGPLDAGYDINTVMATPATQKSIMSVRVGLVVRGEYYDKKLVSPASVTLFNGLTNAANGSLAKSITGLDQHYRYRVFEFTVPLRDLIILAGGP